MAKIQIADLHSENVVELTAEEQSLIQGGWAWIVVPVIFVAVWVLTPSVAYAPGRR